MLDQHQPLGGKPDRLTPTAAGTLTHQQHPDLDQADATNIVANPAGFYFNVHTAINPGGAVRGQLVKQ